MPGPARQSLGAFADWLREERNHPRVTINTYCSAVRRLSRAVPDLSDADALRAAVDAVPMSSAPVLLSAWSAFRAFASATHGIALPEIPRARAPSSTPPSILDAPAPSLPADVLAIVRASLTRGWTVEGWAVASWDHAHAVALIHGADHLVYLLPDAKVGLSLPVPEARRLLAWAWPGASDAPEAPPGALLLPREPEAREPFPAWRLRVLLRS